MFRKIYSLSFTILILGFLTWMFFLSLKEETMPIGTDLPMVEFTDSLGQTKIKYNAKPLLIIYFNTSCEHCQYQLSVFNQHITKFESNDIYFLTSENDFFLTNSNKKWKNLAKAGNVKFGITTRNNFGKLFGSTVTPSLFFFNAQGKLVEKFHGELKPEKIIEIIKSLMSGRAQSAVKLTSF